MRSAHFAVLAAALAALAVVPRAAVGSVTSTETTRYVVVLAGEETADGFQLAGTKEAVTSLVTLAGGSVTYDLSKQIGVLVVDSPNASFAEALRASPLVVEAAEDFKWKAFPTREEAIASGQLTVMHDGEPLPGGGPEPRGGDPLEPLQWSKRLIRAPEAHAIQAGSPLVEVGILDTGIDGEHLDFVDMDGALYAGSRVPYSNVNCAKGADFTTPGPGIGNPDPCTDNGFHGTHVAGIVAARASNGVGVAGVAPNIELIPVKVCDTVGYCYASNTAAGITYAGDMKFEVINMSFYVDDDTFLESHEFKCMSDPVQRAFRTANERAIRYARKQGVVPVAALGNSDNDLAHPPEPYENECEVVPAETDGVIGTMSLGPTSEKAYYSNHGFGMTDVAAPGGNSRNRQGAEIPGPCGTQVLSTIPGNLYGCFQGTSMASPHAAGVAALIVSQFGRIGNDAGAPDVVMRPQDVENHLQSTTIDLTRVGDNKLNGYDACFGNGRIDAVKAVTHDTSVVRHPVEAPADSRGCPSFR
ncbi:MAG TPA: S8 family serine peptidase [Gaiellaceae bacterium]|nr:S8 family serine peptidase [Gaiellaceae bacterium]